MTPRTNRLTRAAKSFVRDPAAATERVLARVRPTHPDPAPSGPDGATPPSFASIAGPGRFRSPDSTVVILADPNVRAPVANWVRQFPAGTVTVIAAREAPEWRLAARGARHVEMRPDRAWHWQLRLIGPVDAIVDLLPEPLDARRRRWSTLFFHLKPGGLYVIDASVGEFDVFGGEGARWVTRLLRVDSTGAGTRARAEARRSTASVSLTRDLIVIEKRLRHYLKLRDLETNRVLAAREKSLTVTELAKLPQGVLELRGTVVSHESSVPVVGLDRSLTYPTLRTRHYAGKVAMVSNGLLHAENTVLADSFRHHLELNPSNVRIEDASSRFARIPPRLQPTVTLPGNYYHLDSANSGHYGHLMTEVTSRLWGWDIAKQTFPDLKVIFRIRYPNERDPTLERRLFEAYGIPADDVVWIDQPVFLESLVAATPMWHNQVPFYVHPGIEPVWRRLSEALIDDAAPEYPKIFVSRQASARARSCRNREAVEALFAEHGFTVIYPDRFDLSAQVGIFSKARVVAGFAGSGMFNVMHARNLSTMIVLTHESYLARNEYLFAAALGCDLHYFWSQADVATGTEEDAAVSRMGQTEGFYSDWEFDFERNRTDLEKLLSGL